MKKKLVLSAMLVVMLALGLAVIGCSSDDDGGGGSVPTELQGNWLRDSGGTERHLRITSNGWGRKSDSFPTDKEISFTITSSTGNKIDYYHNLFPNSSKSFEWAVSGTTLTISNSSADNYLNNGTYTKQP